MIAIALALTAGIAYAVRHREPKADPHFARAQKMLEDYELGRGEEQRDYSAKVYQDVLAELDQVKPASVSAAAARQLADRIRGGIARFRARRQQQALQMAANQLDFAKRADALSSAQAQATGLDPGAAERVTLEGALPGCRHSDGTIHFDDVSHAH